MKTLTPEAFDRLTRMPAREDRIIWTLAAIGARIGTGVDFVRDTLVAAPGSPIRELGGRYYVFEQDLLDFMRASHHHPS
jgi:hypothetical protein